ncbi:hypothetical protein BU15DRAFT_62101 [Melanogaster broomeanus]|nr:hypothetical protein BU15DRAFT_62101 [Melanogaster broomeanus]
MAGLPNRDVPHEGGKPDCFMGHESLWATCQKKRVSFSWDTRFFAFSGRWPIGIRVPWSSRAFPSWDTRAGWGGTWDTRPDLESPPGLRRRASLRGTHYTLRSTWNILPHVACSSSKNCPNVASHGGRALFGDSGVGTRRDTR